VCVCVCVLVRANYIPIHYRWVLYTYALFLNKIIVYKFVIMIYAVGSGKYLYQSSDTLTRCVDLDSVSSYLVIKKKKYLTDFEIAGLAHVIVC